MTNSESRKAWHRIQPASSVRFKPTQGANHKTDEIDTPSFLGDQLKLTPAGERLFICGSNWSNI